MSQSPAPVSIRSKADDLSVDELVSALGPWHEGEGPLYLKLATGLRRLLQQGSIVTGSALPPERLLAARLAVSRNTVSAAYSELRLDGWIDAHQGSATIVTAADFSPVGAHRSSGLFASLLRQHPEVIDLTIAVPDAAPIVSEVITNPTHHFDEAITADHGYYPQGYLPLRSRLAEMLTRAGLSTTPDELLITNGAQQAISLAIRALTRPGDSVGIEEVSFPGAIDSIRLSGATTLPIPHSATGPDLAALEELIKAQRPRLLYLIPTFHNPTGATLSHPDRKRIVSIIAESGVTTIDDLTLADLAFSEPPPPPLALIDPEAPIITVGSLSKVYWGGLRVGWLRANETLTRYLSGVKATADLGSSAVSQKLAYVLLAHHDETIGWRNNRLRESLETCAAALRTLLPEWKWRSPDGGPHLWIKLPDTEASPFVQRLMRNGVAVVAGPLLAARAGAGAHHIRVPIYRPPDELVRAIELMADVWHTNR